MDPTDPDPRGTEAERRLRAADPALGSHPDLARIRADVDERLASPLTEQSASPARPRGRRRAALGAVAAAAVLAVGAGGYALGHSQVPPVAGAGGPPTRDLVGAPGDTGTEEDSAGGSAASSSSLPAVPVRLLPGEGLSTEGGTGEVLAHREAPVSEARLTEVAEAFGVEATTSSADRISGGGRAVSSSGDGSARYLGFEDSYLLSGCADTVASMAEDTARSADPGGGAQDQPDLDPDLCAPEATTELTEEAAVALAEQTARAFGVDPADLGLDVEPLGAEAFVTGVGITDDGTLLRLDATVRAEGTVYASLTLSELVSLGEYPLISPAEAVERSNDPILGRVGISPDGVGAGTQGWPGEEVVEPVRDPVQAGDPVPVSGRVSRATGVELSTGTLWDTAGGQLTVPIYLITTDDDLQLAVLALAEEAVQLRE